VNGAGPADFRLQRLEQRCFAIGVLALAACIAAAFRSPDQFFRSYLMAYVFWSGVCIGCFPVLMMHHLTGGGWGYLIRRLLEAALRALPVMAALVLPALLGIPHLYTWAHPQAMAGNAALRHKRIYLNVPFFALRTVFYFAIWALLAHYLNKWSGEQDRADAPETRRRLYNLSGPGLVIYGLTMTFASMDWVMSLEPEWFSTIYSAMFMVGQVLSSLAFAIAVLLLFIRQAPLREIAAPKYLNDLGNMLLTFVILWAYLAFSQFLIIWSGNLTDEIPWYLHRSRQGWQWIAMALFVFHFAIPFLVLLSRDIKRQAEALSALAGALFLVRLLDMFWMVNPAFDTAGVRFHWLDWAATLGIGGIWVGAFFRRLGQKPLLPVHDPELQAAIERIGKARVGEA